MTYLCTPLNIIDRSRIVGEALRTGRFNGNEFGQDGYTSFHGEIYEAIERMDWVKVYIFCERIYEHLLKAGGHYEHPDYPESWVETKSLSDVRTHYEREINLIIAEENLAFQFVDGKFQRRGRAQTQKSIRRMGTVLADPILTNVRRHYNKAREFFDLRPEADAENCIKEAICALEACAEALSGLPVSLNFSREIKKLQGDGDRQIPATLAESMIRIHAYRGSGQGVAHAALSGSKVSELEAELILNLVASYITYLVDLLSSEEDIPF